MKMYIKRIVFAVFGLALVGICVININKKSSDVFEYMPVTNKTIILDAGHGGIDPGTMSNDESIQEKDLNLHITLKLKKLLESSGAMVFLTREEDVSLYEESEGKTIREKYNENLRNRKAMIEDIEADMFISVHMNALQGVKNAEKYYGAQTFYPSQDEKSKLIANLVQAEMKRVVDNTNNREIKPSEDIYLLKENEIPSILVECGFLSNEKEAHMLTEDEYQNKIAWGMYVAIQQYFSLETEK